MADAAITADEIPEDRKQEASTIVRSYLGWSAGVSLIPIPWIDLGAVSLVQMKMVADLAGIYDVPFSKNLVKTAIGSLLGSAAPFAGTRYLSSYIKSVPVVGSVLGAFTAPAFTIASTYAVGKVFIRHFESGGTTLNFNTDAMRGFFKKEFEAGAEEGSKAGAEKSSN